MGSVILAVTGEEQAYLQRALGPGHDLRWCSSWRVLQGELDGAIDAVICSEQFDDGRLFDLIELVQLQAGTRRIPVYGIVVQARHFSPYFIEGLRSAVTLLGGDGVLDLAGLRRDCGDEEASVMLRTALDGIVASGSMRRRRHQGRRHARELLAA